MARIRSIKPAFFRHRRLYLGEIETGLPLRVAFAGLWTCADREGRFRWEPEELKLDCLPYDEVDFLRVLDALLTRGFVVHYVCEDREYGVIPGFKQHQVINNREAASDLPVPPKEAFEKKVKTDASGTREARVAVATVTPLVPTTGEGKGREGKGKDISTRQETRDAFFEEFWKVYPRRDGANPKVPAEKLFCAAVKAGADPKEIIDGAKRCAQRESKNIGTPYIPQATKWLRDKRWLDYGADAPSPVFDIRAHLA